MAIQEKARYEMNVYKEILVQYKGGHKFFFIFVSIISYLCLDLIL